MKARYIQLTGRKGDDCYMFDRKQLVQGVTKSGKDIPAGGVSLRNGTLAGYVYQNGGMDKTWTIIGKLNQHDENCKYIPSYHTGHSCPAKPIGKATQLGGEEEKVYEHEGAGAKPVSLKTAVQLLRDYYRNSFN